MGWRGTYQKKRLEDGFDKLTPLVLATFNVPDVKPKSKEKKKKTK